jgi:hypothetical protein
MNPIKLGIYRHYKVIGFAKHSKTLEDVIREFDNQKERP